MPLNIWLSYACACCCVIRHLSGWWIVHHKHQTWIHLAVTEAHFLFFPPWIADHYSLPPYSTFSCFVRVLIPLSPLCVLHAFDLCLQVIVAWLLMVWLCPGACIVVGSSSSCGFTCAQCLALLSQVLLRLQNCMPMWHFKQQWSACWLLCLAHTSCRGPVAGAGCRGVPPCA